MTHAHDKILIVDFGSQVTQLIARRVREEGVYSEIVPFQSAAKAFREMNPKGVILSGGPASVPEAGSPRAPQEIFDAVVPVLTIDAVITQTGIDHVIARAAKDYIIKAVAAVDDIALRIAILRRNRIG